MHGSNFKIVSWNLSVYGIYKPFPVYSNHILKILDLTTHS